MDETFSERHGYAPPRLAQVESMDVLFDEVEELLRRGAWNRVYEERAELVISHQAGESFPPRRLSRPLRRANCEKIARAADSKWLAVRWACAPCSSASAGGLTKKFSIAGGARAGVLYSTDAGLLLVIPTVRARRAPVPAGRPGRRRGDARMKLAAVGALLLAVACAGRNAASPTPHTATPAVVAVPPVSAVPAAGAACKLDAPRTTLQSSRPPAWLADEEQQGPCEMSDAGPLRDEPFTVRPTGPSGSGRYWEVLVSWLGAEGPRGFCLSTSSGGWRHVGADERLVQAITPLLRWSQDVDGDGQPELVLRSTLEFSDDASLDEACITASAYDQVEDGFVLDPESTRTLRAKLAQAYRTASERREHGEQRQHYMRAAERLTATACRP